MKKYFFLFALLIGFTTVMAQGNGGQEQRARQKAEAAARQCAGNLSGLELHSAATANMICDYINPNPNYFGYQVEVWATPNCPPNQFCIQIVYPIATVLVDCRGDVYDVQCHTAVPQ